jgi:general secretion pathway protein E
MSVLVDRVIQADPVYLSKIGHDFAREHLLIWVDGEQGLQALHAQSTPPEALHNVSVLLERWPEHAETEASQLAEMIDDAYANQLAQSDTRTQFVSAGLEQAHDELESIIRSNDADLLSTSGKSPVVRLIDGLLFEGIRSGGSDIHFQPNQDGLLVRYRIDGALIDARTLPERFLAPITSRIKVMGQMDIAETRVPQDGRASVTVGQSTNDGQSHEIDLRISTLPTSGGERVVIRFLDSNQGQRLSTLESIGMPTEILESYRLASSRPNGIILLTGPTGSGKTTTLYATLRHIASHGGATGGGDLNIMTIEDPIEYKLSTSGFSISQSQVNRKKGMTFASGLRHILRQDPDVVMVGEIRDTETAQIAIQSSLTGHLVFSTLHTNDSVSAPPRLIDLGIEPYLISASLSAVLAQRLVRKVHQECQGEGCDGCLHAGYSGRTGIFELLRMTDPIRDLISGSASAAQLRKVARTEGWRSLREDGQRLIDSGVTSQAEIERVAIDLASEGER